jgi:hypothetical protein
MQAEKATADWEFVDPPALGEPPEPVAGGLLLLHAAASSTRTAVAMVAAADAGGRDRRGRSMTCVLSFIVPSWGWSRASSAPLARGCTLSNID